jgi:hypothetical protein
MNYKLVFILPSMSRNKKFFETVDNLNEMCLSDNYEILAILEKGDATMDNDVVKERLAYYENLKYHFITSTGKVNAINQSLNYLPEDAEIIILIADDIRFTMKGFDSFINEDMQQYSKDLDILLHYPDNIPQSGQRQITMPVIGRKLLDSWGYIYHSSFISVYCDNFQLEVAKRTGKYHYNPIHFYEHRHPAFKLGEWDELYKKNESFYGQDGQTYFKHLENNFGL